MENRTTARVTLQPGAVTNNAYIVVPLVLRPTGDEPIQISWGGGAVSFQTVTINRTVPATIGGTTINDVTLASAGRGRVALPDIIINENSPNAINANANNWTFITPPAGFNLIAPHTNRVMNADERAVLLNRANSWVLGSMNVEFRHFTFRDGYNQATVAGTAARQGVAFQISGLTQNRIMAGSFTLRGLVLEPITAQDWTWDGGGNLSLVISNWHNIINTNNDGLHSTNPRAIAPNSVYTAAGTRWLGATGETAPTQHMRPVPVVDGVSAEQNHVWEALNGSRTSFTIGNFTFTLGAVGSTINVNAPGGVIPPGVTGTAVANPDVANPARINAVDAILVFIATLDQADWQQNPSMLAWLNGISADRAMWQLFYDDHLSNPASDVYGWAGVAAVRAMVANLLAGFSATTGATGWMIAPAISHHVVWNPRTALSQAVIAHDHVATRNVLAQITNPAFAATTLVTIGFEPIEATTGATGGIGIVSAGISTRTLDVATFTGLGSMNLTATATNLWSGRLNQNAGLVTLAAPAINFWTLQSGTDFVLEDAAGNNISDMVRIQNIHIYNHYSRVRGIAHTVNSNNRIPHDRVWAADSVNNPNFFFGRDGGSFRLMNVWETTNNEVPQLVFTPRLSAHPDFEGEVFLRATGFTVEGAFNERVHIATFHRPFIIEAETTNVRIGYQVFDVENITIRENLGAFDGATVFQTNDRLEIGVGAFGRIAQLNNQFVTQRMGFNPINSSNVVLSPNLRLINVGVQHGVINLLLERQAGTAATAATITLQGLSLDVDRNVPFGNYDLIVRWTPANNRFASNNLPADGNLAVASPLFPVDGFRPANTYVRLVTPGESVNRVRDVSFTIGADHAWVDGQRVLYANLIHNGQAMGVPELRDSRTWVPIRLVAALFGLDMETEVIWNNNLQTVVIRTPNGNVAEFQIGRTYYVLDGIRFDIWTENTVSVFDENFGIWVERTERVPVAPFIDATTGRTMVPIRFVADALGALVSWDTETNTATFNYRD